MRKITLFFLVMGLTITCFSAVSISALAADDVTIGILLPLSGPVAPIGSTAKMGYEMAAMEINNEGGISSLDGAKIKLVYADTRGDAKIGLSEAERLIVRDKVKALSGAYQSGVTLTSTQVAERYQVPYVTAVSVADSITERGFKYVFRPNETAGMTAMEIFRFLSSMGRATGTQIKTLGFLYENTEWGQSSAKAWHEYAEKFGMQVILDEPYPSSTTDITPVILKFKKKNPDAIVNVSYLSDIILIVKTMAENKYAPKAFISGGGGEIEPDFIEAVGNLADYNLTVLPWASDLLLVQPWAKKMAEAFKEKFGVELSCVSSETYATLNVLVAAIEAAGSTDKNKIRDALSNMEITVEGAEQNKYWRRSLLFPYKKIAFDENGQNKYVRVPICQFQDKQLRIIYPDDIVPPGVVPVWPAPPWSER